MRVCVCVRACACVRACVREGVELMKYDSDIFAITARLFRDVCMFACALLLALDRLVNACFMH